METKSMNSSGKISVKFAAMTGASSGIGFELAKQFAQNGFDLMIVTEEDGIHKAAERLREFGKDVHPRQIDLANENGAELG